MDLHEGEEEGAAEPQLADSERDINTRLLIILGSIIVGAAVLVFVGVAFGLNWLSRQDARAPARGLNPVPTAIQARPTVALPPEPHLQSNEPADLEAIRAQWERELTTYGWADDRHTRVRIPIEQAKQLLLQRGVQVREGAKGTLNSDDDLEVEDSSSGRITGDHR